MKMQNNKSVQNKSKWKYRCIIASVALAITLILIAINWGINKVQVAQTWVSEGTHRATCSGFQEAIWTEIERYRDKHGHFPPAFIADKNGKPMHSWRILILADREPFNKYNFNEPWDSENNRKLADKLPVNFFACPGDKHRSQWNTSYVAITGPGTVFPSPPADGKQEFTRDFVPSIMIAEMADSGIQWMEPRDLHVETMSFQLNEWSLLSIRSHHGNIVNVTLANGVRKWLKDTIPSETIKAMTLIKTKGFSEDRP